MTKFTWAWSEYGGYRAEMPGNVTLCATPDHTKGFAGKPTRGTTWRAGVSQWDEATRTISGFGQCDYATLHRSYKDAMRAAESAYCAVIQSDRITHQSDSFQSKVD